MQGYAERDRAACLEHSSLFKVGFDQLGVTPRPLPFGAQIGGRGFAAVETPPLGGWRGPRGSGYCLGYITAGSVPTTPS
jgi:hypothetical protein